jgi:hypothetical protein
MRYGQSLPSNSFSSKNVPHLTEKRYSALLSLQENKNSSRQAKALLIGQSSDRKLIETYVLSANGESPSV